MNPYHISYLLELCTLIGRLRHAIASRDDSAFVGILKLIRDLTDRSIDALSPRKRPVIRVVDDTTFFDAEDDEL